MWGLVVVRMPIVAGRRETDDTRSNVKIIDAAAEFLKSADDP
jgi:hypothetical protein